MNISLSESLSESRQPFTFCLATASTRPLTALVSFLYRKVLSRPPQYCGIALISARPFYIVFIDNSVSVFRRDNYSQDTHHIPLLIYDLESDVHFVDLRADGHSTSPAAISAIYSSCVKCSVGEHG